MTERTIFVCDVCGEECPPSADDRYLVSIQKGSGQATFYDVHLDCLAKINKLTTDWLADQTRVLIAETQDKLSENPPD